MEFRDVLERLMLNQADVAKMLRTSEFSVSRWCAGQVTMRKKNRRLFLRRYTRALEEAGVDPHEIVWPAKQARSFHYRCKLHNPNSRPINILIAGQVAEVPAKGDRTINYRATQAYRIEPELSDGDLPVLLRLYRSTEAPSDE